MRRIGVFLTVWGALVVLGSLLAAATQGAQLARDATSTWHPIEGEVIAFREGTRPSGRVTVPTASVTVRAHFAGREVVGVLDVPHSQRARYAHGARVQVFIDPESPGRLLLEPPTVGMVVGHAVLIPAALVLGLVSIGGGVSLLRRHRA